MTRVVIQPAGGPESREHFADTIQQLVSQDRLRPFLSTASALSEVCLGPLGNSSLTLQGVTKQEVKAEDLKEKFVRE